MFYYFKKMTRFSRELKMKTFSIENNNYTKFSISYHKQVSLIFYFIRVETVASNSNKMQTL